MLYHLFLHISKTRNLLLSFTNITNLSVILYVILKKLVSDLDIETSFPGS